MAVSVSWRRSGQTDIRGLVTAGRDVSAGSVRWSKGRAWQREPLLLIVRSRVTSTRCHSRSVTAYCHRALSTLARQEPVEISDLRPGGGHHHQQIANPAGGYRKTQARLALYTAPAVRAAHATRGRPSSVKGRSAIAARRPPAALDPGASTTHPARQQSGVGQGGPPAGRAALGTLI
jgi:hypothetical protein